MLHCCEPVNDTYVSENPKYLFSINTYKLYIKNKVLCIWNYLRKEFQHIEISTKNELRRGLFKQYALLSITCRGQTKKSMRHVKFNILEFETFHSKWIINRNSIVTVQYYDPLHFMKATTIIHV